jgi:hypothetical protein
MPEDLELQRAWVKFARAVETNDLPSLHQLSTGCIPAEQGQSMQKAFAFTKTRQGYNFCG